MGFEKRKKKKENDLQHSLGWRGQSFASMGLVGGGEERGMERRRRRRRRRKRRTEEKTQAVFFSPFSFSFIGSPFLGKTRGSQSKKERERERERTRWGMKWLTP